MASFAAQMLDELMGRSRNNDPNEKRRDLEWSDSEICKYYLCGFCPHELFTNTRADLGGCDKIHDDEMAKAYQKSSRCLKMGYEEEFLTFLQNLISEVDRRIRRGHQRLALNAAHTAGAVGAHEEKIQLLTEKINQLVEKAEALGCEGQVEEAQGTMKLCEQLKEERAQLQDVKNQPMNPLAPKEMEVCPVCGAFLVVGDAQQRVEEHLLGKQHMGYAKVRATIDNLRKKLRGEDPEREARLQKEREEREREKEMERQREKEREREREREREKRREEEEAERRRKDKERKEREDKHRSRSHRSRSKESRSRRSRSRSRHSRKRSRSRSSERHRCSKSSKHSHRSRSREGHRHSSRDREHRRHSRERSGRDRDERMSKEKSKEPRSSRDEKVDDEVGDVSVDQMDNGCNGMDVAKSGDSN